MPVSLLSGVRLFTPQTGLLLLILHIFSWALVKSGSGLIFLEAFWWSWFCEHAFEPGSQH